MIKSLEEFNVYNLALDPGEYGNQLLGGPILKKIQLENNW
jgi:hypothetical protein